MATPPSFVLSSHKIPRYHFWQWDDFHKTLWGNFRTLQPKISPFKDIGQQKVGSKSPTTILQIYKQCVRPIFEYGIVSTITVSETVITKIQRVQNSFIRLALRLPKYVSARLLHEASGLPHVRERLITVGQNHLARMHANPLGEHTINSVGTNIAWDKYKTPICILKPPDWTTDTHHRMQESEVTTHNVQPLTLEVMVRPIPGHVWHSARTQNQSQHGYVVVAFSGCFMHPKGLDHGDVISLFYIITRQQLFICSSNCFHK